ncbi:hypothetical protein BGW37DRAFT_236858 [Umbelopsis sp. PMI_123]|nr:hypothetical protein BGW37DRAFT_236858 [Umbelopsis sp. PMI_123]
MSDATAKSRKDEKPNTVVYAAEKLSLPHEIAFVLILSCAQLIVQASIGQALAALRIIGAGVGFTVQHLNWSSAAFAMTLGPFICVAGRLGDLYGHRKIFIAGFLWYSLWALIAGFAAYPRSGIFFAICRGFQGIGGACILPSSQAILGQAYPPYGVRKDVVFCIYAAMSPIGFVLGAFFASLFGQLAWWPWAFWSAAIAGCAIAIFGCLVIPDQYIWRSDRDIEHTADFPGSLTLAVGLVLIAFAWSQAPAVGWGTPYIIALLILGFIFLVAFCFIERCCDDPLIPCSIYDRESVFVLTAMAAGWAGFGIWLYYTWQFMEVIRGSTPLNATAKFTPFAITGIFSATAAAYLVKRLKISYIMIISMVFFCVGIILIATAPPDQIYWAQTFVSIVLMPCGVDLSFPAATILMSNHTPQRQQGMASSLVNGTINYAIAIGLGMAGTIDSLTNDKGTNPLAGYRHAWYFAIGLSGLAIFISISHVVVDHFYPMRRIQQSD